MSGYDLIVVGAGPGGYVAAIRAAQLGLRAAVVERAHLGGVCLNWGCIPTKSLLHGAETARRARHADRIGLSIGAPAIEAAPLVARSREVADQLAGGIGWLLRKNAVDLIWGEATIPEPGVVAVSAAEAPAPKGAFGPGVYAAGAIVIATGAAPRRLPALEPDGDRVWTYYEALRPESLPTTLLVVGAGAIGVEFASLYAALGVSVTLVEEADRVLPTEDPEISEAMGKALRKDGIVLATGVRVAALEKTPEGVTAYIDDGRAIGAERALSAVGVLPNIGGLGLERLGVATARGSIVVDGAGRTSVPGLYAIGDVAGAPMLAHKAEHDAVRCVEAIAGRAPADAHGPIPACVFARPQVASVGLTEPEAAARGHAVRVGRFPFRGNGKAVVLGETEGFVKVIVDAGTDRLLGAHLIGAEASELVAGYCIAIGLGATAGQLRGIVLPHPTLSEALHEAGHAAGEGAIHA